MLRKVAYTGQGMAAQSLYVIASKKKAFRKMIYRTHYTSTILRRIGKFVKFHRRHLIRFFSWIQDTACGNKYAPLDFAAHTFYPIILDIARQS